MIPFPNKKYDVIYADPPWSYQQAMGTDAKKYYSTMNIDDICNLPVEDISKDSTILFMWATFPQLPDALRVINSWGFQYKTCGFVWIKQNKKSDSLFMGCGAYTRTNAEVCLIGVKKKAKISSIIKSHSVRQVIISPIRKHSQKPPETRERIMELVGKDNSFIELFARNTTPGWDVWGNETNKYDV